ncbi:MAG: class I SAM-dependent methyltransferase [Acidobacteriota bacterium]
MSLARYYAWLSRFQDVARAVGHDTGQATLSVHRLLATPSGAVSGDVVHERVLAALDDLRSPSTELVGLDAGCGLGGTTFYLQARLGGTWHGITLSPEQRDRAARAAAQRGLAQTCRFTVRGYDEPLGDLLPDGADVIIAIESLAHSPDPVASVTHLAALLRPGGRLVVVDDLPEDGLSVTDADFAAFRRGWICPVVASASRLLDACRSAGLVVRGDHDLTPLLRPRDPRALARLVRLNELASWLLRVTPARVLLGSLHGGLMLERLYARQQMRYRLLVAERPLSAEAS